MAMREWPRLHPTRQKHVQRLRRAGIVVLAVCIGVAILVYRVGVMHHQPTARELIPGSTAVIERQRGLLYGRAGVALMRWYDALGQPEGQAFLVVVAGVISALAFYQVAHSIEVDEG